MQDYDDFDMANELDELDKFFDISTKSPPKELNGSSSVVNNKIIYKLYTIKSYRFQLFILYFNSVFRKRLQLKTQTEIMMQMKGKY